MVENLPATVTRSGDSKVLKSAMRRPPNAGKGRRKGVPNKTTAAVKDMILQALNEAHEGGGVAYLKDQASKNPTAFLTLVGKLIPLDVNATIAGGLVLDHREAARAEVEELFGPTDILVEPKR